MKLMEPAYRLMESDVTARVANVVAAKGVPTGLEAADDLADALFPLLLESRRNMWAQESALILEEHPDLEVPEVAFYPQTATRKLVRRSAGLSPKPELMQLELFDPETVELQKTSVAPYLYPGEEEVLEEMGRRLAAGAARHVKAASRDLVTETAARNRVGWARRLTGAENCGFCAMLASRGAVYSKESVKFRTHDHCDCTAEIVRDAAGWDGKEEADRLYQLWKKSGGLAEFTVKYREEFFDALAT